MRPSTTYALLGLKEEFGWDFVDNFNFARACDVGTLQTNVLTRVSKEQFNSQQCHFGALEERLPPEGQTWLKAAVPDSTLPRQQREEANRDIYQWLKSNKSWLFAPGAKSYCHVHGRQCPVHPKYAERQSAERETKRPRLATNEALPANGLGSGSQLRAEEPHPDPLYINVAGLVCVAWSTEGSQEQTAHSSGRPHSVWSCERQAFAARGDEHLFFAECTPRYQVQKLLVGEMPDHEIFNLVTGPETMGSSTSV